MRLHTAIPSLLEGRGGWFGPDLSFDRPDATESQFDMIWDVCYNLSKQRCLGR
jgi:hypothetical protein